MEGGEYSHIMARPAFCSCEVMVLSRVRAGAHALHTQSSIGDGAKTVTSRTFCASALRLCALWSILLRLPIA